MKYFFRSYLSHKFHRIQRARLEYVPLLLRVADSQRNFLGNDAIRQIWSRVRDYNDRPIKNTLIRIIVAESSLIILIAQIKPLRAGSLITVYVIRVFRPF